uniref:ABC transporter permease n=1 Tax=Kribbia dieselivorans TaxID=331526 RepID=UPI000B3339F8
VSPEAAAALAVTSGDVVEVGGRRVTVAGVGANAQYAHAPVIWVTPDDAPRNGRPTGGATFLAVTTQPGSGAALVAADHRLGTVTRTPKESLSAIGSYASENGSLQLMRALLFVISALVVGAFFTVWTVQRTGEVAILKALGASNVYLLRDALGQALVLLAAGTTLGSALAVAVGVLIERVGGGTVPFVLDPPTVLVPALVLVALGLLGAGVSLRSVTTVDPLTALGSAR